MAIYRYTITLYVLHNRNIKRLVYWQYGKLITVRHHWCRAAEINFHLKAKPNVSNAGISLEKKNLNWRKIIWCFSLTKGQSAWNVRLYFLYRQYTNLFIFWFVSQHCLRSTLRLYTIYSLFYKLFYKKKYFTNCPVLSQTTLMLRQ